MQQAAPTLGVAQRAALLVEAPDEPGKVKTYLGTVVWKLDNVSNGPGQPLTTAVRADVDIPDDKMQVSLVFQKNLDPSLPASHTIKIRFTVAPDSPTGSVRQINVPQMRRDDTPSGDSLSGIPVPITDNVFLVGLTRGPPEDTNMDLLRGARLDRPADADDQRSHRQANDREKHIRAACLSMTRSRPGSNRANSTGAPAALVDVRSRRTCGLGESAFMLVRRLVLFFGLLVGLAATQMPEFVQQYRAAARRRDRRARSDRRALR